MKGPDNSLRVRQLKVLGERKCGNPVPVLHQTGNPDVDLMNGYSGEMIQQQNCEQETLKVFRLITSQVFGSLLENGNPEQPQHAPRSPVQMEEAYFKVSYYWGNTETVLQMALFL